MFMTVVIKCHLVNYDTFNAKLTIFKMSYDNLTLTKTKMSYDNLTLTKRS